MDRSKKNPRGTLTRINIGVYEDQIDNMKKLELTTGKGQGRVIRDAIDFYFAQYRVFYEGEPGPRH